MYIQYMTYSCTLVIILQCLPCYLDKVAITKWEERDWWTLCDDWWREIQWCLSKDKEENGCHCSLWIIGLWREERQRQTIALLGALIPHYAQVLYCIISNNMEDPIWRACLFISAYKLIAQNIWILAHLTLTYIYM